MATVLMVLAGPALSADHPWQPQPAKAALMVVGSHPDDEGLYLGGTMPYYAGVLNKPTVWVTMTSGDSSVPTSVRDAEACEAAWTYGLENQPIFGYFKDYGFSGTIYERLQKNWSMWNQPNTPATFGPGGSYVGAPPPPPDDPSQYDAGRWKVATFLAQQIRTYKPDVVVTQELRGEYGHANHLTTAWGVWDAYWLAADPSVNINGLPAWQAPKLYYHLYHNTTTGDLRIMSTPDVSLPGKTYPTSTTIINKQYQDWSTPYAELGGLTPLQDANAALAMYASIDGPNLPNQFSVRYSEEYGLYASTVGPDTVGPDGWARGGFFENIITVPEPSTLVMLAVAALGMVGYGVRRRG